MTSKTESLEIAMLVNLIACEVNQHRASALKSLVRQRLRALGLAIYATGEFRKAALFYMLYEWWLSEYCFPVVN